MIIAEQKLKENIAEYILYMYQVEDMIRANNLDLDSIEETLISKFEVPYEVKREMREWYKSLIAMMVDEGKEESGHIRILSNKVEQLEELHVKTLHDGIDQSYAEAYRRARPHLQALRRRSGDHAHHSHHTHEEKDPHAGEIQVALNGLYGLLILKLKKTHITEETTKAFETIRDLVAELSSRYMERDI